MYQPIGNKDILKTKIPRSGKYDDVGPTLNTGGNVLKKAPPEPVKLGHEELFKRMKGRTLHRLLTEPNPEVKVVLLDVRPPEAYEQCHIMEASNYPHTMLSRSTNEYTPAVFQNKNKEGVLLVCYDEDESIAINTCNTMFKKGIDNIMMLTGMGTRVAGFAILCLLHPRVFWEVLGPVGRWLGGGVASKMEQVRWMVEARKDC